MKNDDKASISLKKIICISILFVFIMTAAVVAGNVKLNNVKIILASGYEMNVLTSKTKIADILDTSADELLGINDEPQTIATNFDGDEYTEEELSKIKEFAQFVKSSRK